MPAQQSLPGRGASTCSSRNRGRWPFQSPGGGTAGGAGDASGSVAHAELPVLTLHGHTR